jgi:hypothetical protein
LVLSIAVSLIPAAPFRSPEVDRVRACGRDAPERFALGESRLERVRFAPERDRFGAAVFFDPEVAREPLPVELLPLDFVASAISLDSSVCLVERPGTDLAAPD